MKKGNFDRLMKSADQALEHAEGKRKDLRTTVLVKPPIQMKKAEIVNLREKLNVSQAVFANYLNISVKTVQAWEQGIGRPSGAALKLLTIAKRKPELLLEV